MDAIEIIEKNDMYRVAQSNKEAWFHTASDAAAFICTLAVFGWDDARQGAENHGILVISTEHEDKPAKTGELNELRAQVAELTERLDEAKLAVRTLNNIFVTRPEDKITACGWCGFYTCKC